jgi:hypothetical protein
MMATIDNPPSFARDIQPLFRENDREEMQFAFDLWDYDDVRAHAQEILNRIEDGSMPCDEEWPEEQMMRFRAWMDAGMPA